ncbi:MAG: hypothetical protein HY308_12225 [Gammaproteobacteria bacterium]|nr:hypothetical protein [Gammaproteobacteria bacterium]
MTDTTQKQVPSAVSLAAIFLLCASILLPNGVGFRFAPAFPNLDLPRIAMLALLGLLVVQLPKLKLSALNRAPRTLSLLAAVAVWQFLSAVVSSSPKWSVIWAVGNVVTYWGFAFAVIVLIGSYDNSKRMVYALTATAALLALWSVFEFITQTKLVPERNIYLAAERLLFSTTTRRRVLIGDVEIQMPFMSIGPYANNLMLTGAICALGGFLLIRNHRSVALYVLGVAVFVFAVLSAQSRAGLVALCFMLGLAVFWARSHKERVWIVFSTLAAVVAFVLVFGVGKFTLAFTYHLSSPPAATATQSTTQSAEQAEVSAVAATPAMVGSIQGRWHGLKMLGLQAVNAWMFGYGPGSVFNSERVITPLRFYSDQGSFFSFFVEIGIVGGAMLALLVFVSVFEGIRSRDPRIRAAVVGLMGFGVTTLSSLPPVAWGIALVLAGIIESWSKADQSRRAAEQSERAEQNVDAGDVRSAIA